MNAIYSTLKSVTPNTKLIVVTLYSDGERKLALMDQDGDIVGLTTTDRPYFPPGSFESAAKAANSLKPNAPYKGYPARKFGQYDYTLETASELEFSDHDNRAIKDAEDLFRQSLDLYRRITGKESSIGSIEGDFEVVEKKQKLDSLPDLSGMQP